MEKNYIKVSALNNYIKLLIDDNSFLRKVYLKGEISNYKNHMSGHLYFTLKDEEAKISAIMFRNKTIDLKFTPEDGKKVLVEGRVSAYPTQGTYQIYVEKMEEDGLGNLYVLYEELKNKLQKEGLFDQKYKKPIPKYPSKIGIVTAPAGAAIKDILSTIKRRFPICETIFFPALVQGANAGCDVARQINAAQNYDLDLLIVGRGGGSIEDLWTFNEEVVARAIFNSKIPVISAVGHEIDYTISDFVADLRAPTPTGAAEMAVPTILEVQEKLSHYNAFLNHNLKKRIELANQKLEQLKCSYILKNPSMLYDIKMQTLAHLEETVNVWIKQMVEKKKSELSQISSSYILKNPLATYETKQEQLKNIKTNCTVFLKNILSEKEHNLKYTINTLKLVNPLNILEKGYSFVKKGEKIIKNSNDLQKDDIISIKMKEGSVIASVKEVQ